MLISVLVGIVSGLPSCGGVQIASEKRTLPKQTQQEKASPDKKAQKEAPQGETREKSYLEKAFQQISPRDTFTRMYPIDFRNFHSQVLSSLQEYAKANKGNSFQVQRLGNDQVLIRGVYLSGKEQKRLITNLTLKPVNARKCALEIKFISTGSDGSANMESAAQSLFSIIEESSAVRPQ